MKNIYGIIKLKYIRIDIIIDRIEIDILNYRSLFNINLYFL
jgi:hypothetical protein